MNLQQANLEDLLRFYFSGTAAHEATERLGSMIRKEQDTQLATLLRHHDMRSIDDPKEIEMRAAVDRLMNCYAVLEIASLTGFVGDLNSEKGKIDFFPILENRHVRRYYEEFYPNRLPQMFRARVRGVNDVSQKDSSNTYVLAFLELDRQFIENLEDKTLLRMLDSFVIDGWTFDDVVKLIEDPLTFADHLLIEPKKRDARSYALYEFGLFLEFCFDLEKLLALTASQPLLQSEIWSYYSYWFEILGDELCENLDEALKRFLWWKPPEGIQEDAHLHVQQYVSKARATLGELTSQKFAQPVDGLLSEFRRS